MEINELRAATDQAVAAEISSIEARLAVLRDEPIVTSYGAPITVTLPGGAVTSRQIATALGGNHRGNPKRRKVSPQQAESRRTQGVYLSLIRRVPKSRRVEYQAIAKEAGREAAIVAMRQR
jgi:hypothetical protein